MWHDALTETKDGTYIDIRASPGSGRSGLRGYDEWRKCILIDLRSEPRQGMANSELVSLVSQLLQVPPSSVSISSGQTSHQKRVFVESLRAEEVKGRLGELLGPV